MIITKLIQKGKRAEFPFLYAVLKKKAKRAQHLLCPCAYKITNRKLSVTLLFNYEPVYAETTCSEYSNYCDNNDHNSKCAQAIKSNGSLFSMTASGTCSLFDTLSLSCGFLL